MPKAALLLSLVLATACAPQLSQGKAAEDLPPLPSPSARPDPAPTGHSQQDIIARLEHPHTIRDNGREASAWTVKPDELRDLLRAVGVEDVYVVSEAGTVGDWEPLLSSAFMVNYAGPEDRFLNILTLIGRDRAVGDALYGAYRARFEQIHRYKAAAATEETPVRAVRDIEQITGYRITMPDETGGRKVTGQAVVARGWSSIVILSADARFPIEVLLRGAELEFSRLPQNE